MDLRSIFIIVVLVVVLNSFLLFFLFWYFFRNKSYAKTKRHSASSDAKIKSVDSVKEKNRFKLLIFVASVTLALGISYLFNFRINSRTVTSLSLENSQNGQKSEFYRNPEKIYPRGLNLIFFADDYPSWEDFDSDVSNLMIGIKQIEPWKSYNNYNIYKINPGKENQLCQIKTENERKPVLRCDTKINNLLGRLQLENFRLVVLSRKDFQSWANVTRLADSGIFFSVKDKIDESNGLATSYLFSHLLGHSFGLKDEEKYVIAKADGAPHAPNGPNCAPDEETARRWWGTLAERYPDRVGYFKTCAGSDAYIRPTESSLMNFGNMEKFIPDYGPVSEAYLKKMLDYCFSEKVVTQEKDPVFFEQYPEFKQCL
jgi:hypothetical protein